MSRLNPRHRTSYWVSQWGLGPVKLGNPNKSIDAVLHARKTALIRQLLAKDIDDAEFNRRIAAVHGNFTADLNR